MGTSILLVIAFPLMLLEVLPDVIRDLMTPSYLEGFIADTIREISSVDYSEVIKENLETLLEGIRLLWEML